MIDEKHIPLLIDKFPALDLSWPEAKIQIWLRAFALMLRGLAQANNPKPGKKTLDAPIAPDSSVKPPSLVIVQEGYSPSAAHEKRIERGRKMSAAMNASWAARRLRSADPGPAPGADKPSQKGGRPAGAEMCPGCHKMIKPVHLSVKVNDRPWHAECAPEE